MKRARILAQLILVALLVLPFAGCATGTAPTPEQLAAYNRLILSDYKVIKAVQKAP